MSKETLCTSLSAASPIQLPQRPCPACGMPSPAALVLLPSGRRALIEACAVCGRQAAVPVGAQQAAMLLEQRDPQPVGRAR